MRPALVAVALVLGVACGGGEATDVRATDTRATTVAPVPAHEPWQPPNFTVVGKELRNAGGALGTVLRFTIALDGRDRTVDVSLLTLGTGCYLVKVGEILPPECR